MVFIPVVTGCSDDGDTEVNAATIQRACDVICGKLDSCGLLFGRTDAQCLSDCVEPDNGPSNACEVSNAQANACIDAIEASACSQFTTGIVQECDFCSNDGVDGGISTDGGLPSGDAGTPSFDAGAGVGCNELRTCCPQLPVDGQAGCTTTADQGNDAACAAALAVFQAAQLCP